MFGRLANMVARAAGATLGGPRGTLMPVPRTQGQWNGVFTSLFGAPGASDPTHDRVVQDLYNGPYRGPLDLDRYGGETAAQRREYREQHSKSPVFRAAINGQRDDIATLEPTIISGNKDNPVANDAAEFVKWTVSTSPGGWPGLINNIYLPGSIDGFSVLEKKLRTQFWRGRQLWGLAHTRSLDTLHIRLQLDSYRNVVGVVNMVRGLEHYDPDGYILYTHNGLYNNPFGQSDGRAAITAARMISDVYMLWYVALKVYGLPYMHGKTKAQNRKMMETALTALRAGGWAVTTEPEDKIEVINLATGAALNGFESFIHTKREDIFFAVRNVAQPFMEGDGGADSHTDTGVQQNSSNAGEKFKAHNVVEVIKGQLIPWLCRPNFDLDESEYPQAKLGGTDWGLNQKIVASIKEMQEAGFDVSKKWAQSQVAAEPATTDDDRLVSAQEKQQQQAAQQQQQQPGAPTIPGAPNQPPGPTPPQPPAKPAPERPAEPKAFSDAVKWLPTSRLSADPERFQFRRGADADDGTVRDLPDVRFDPARREEPFLVWHDPDDGEDYVVDGHHGLAWAERDGVKRVPCRFIAADTAEEAREIGRKANQRSRAAKTFSDAHRPQAPGVDAAQVQRVIDGLIRELVA